VIRRLTLAAALVPALTGFADTAAIPVRIGDVHEITRIVDRTQQADSGMTGESHDRDALIERVTGVRDDGVELEYDLSSATPREREIAWQFPARVFKPKSGPSRLLDVAHLRARADRYLKRAKLPRSACGHWYFTWTAFRVECDPQMVIRAIDALDLGPADPTEGALYRDAAASAPAPLKRVAGGPDGATFTVDLPVDPEQVRRARAEADVVVAEVSRKTLTLDDALRARSGERITGTMSITIDADAAGQIRRRTKVVRLEIGAANGVERSTTTETIERRLVTRGKG
jgi:hypothetical protein